MRLLLCLFLVLPLLASAQTQWKWRDAQGQVQYSDRPPPPGVADKDILARPPGSAPRRVQIVPFGEAASAASAPRPAAPAASTAVERAAALDKAKGEAAKKAQEQNREKLQQQQRADNCRSARSQLAQLQSGARIARMNDKGEREVMEDAQRGAEIQRAQRVIASDCR